MSSDGYLNYCVPDTRDPECYGKILYHYCPLKHGESDLKNERAKLSFPYTFNDPLDSVGYYRQYPTFAAFMKYFADILLPPEVRESLHKSKKEDMEIWYENRDMIAHAFSKLCRGNRGPCSKNLLMSLCGGTDKDAEVLLWSHYADSAKGMRIGYFFPIDVCLSIHKIDYLKNLPSLDFFQLTSYDPRSKDLGKCLHEYHYRILTTKQKVWQYEEEYRIITNEDDKINVFSQGGLWFLRIPNRYVKVVDFGAKTFGDDEYKRDQLFLARAKSLSENTNIPIRCFRMAELQVEKYGFRYVGALEAYRRLKRRLSNKKLSAGHNLKMPRGICRMMEKIQRVSRGYQSNSTSGCNVR